MSFNIYEPWRDAEAHAARLEEEYRKYGTGNCESCGKTVWHDEHFCSECMEIAIDNVRYFTDWLAEKNGWPREIALETALRILRILSCFPCAEEENCDRHSCDFSIDNYYLTDDMRGITVAG